VSQGGGGGVTDRQADVVRARSGVVGGGCEHEWLVLCCSCLCQLWLPRDTQHTRVHKRLRTRHDQPATASTASCCRRRRMQRAGWCCCCCLCVYVVCGGWGGALLESLGLCTAQDRATISGESGKGLVLCCVCVLAMVFHSERRRR
jgi:hypothetical protein